MAVHKCLPSSALLYGAPLRFDGVFVNLLAVSTATACLSAPCISLHGTNLKQGSRQPRQGAAVAVEQHFMNAAVCCYMIRQLSQENVGSWSSGIWQDNQDEHGSWVLQELADKAFVTLSNKDGTS